MKHFLKQICKKLKAQSGIGTVEVILILVVLLALVLAFKTQLSTLAETIFTQITTATRRIF